MSIPDTEKCSAVPPGTLAASVWREGYTALGENRLLDEIEPVGEFDLFRNGTSTDPRPDFAENRTLAV